MVEVLPADELVPAGLTDDLEPVVGALQHGGVERASAEVVDADVGADRDVFGGVVDRCGDRLLDEGDLAEPGPFPGGEQCLPAHTGPTHRVGQDAVRRGGPSGAQPALGDDHPQDCSGGVDRVERIAADEDRGTGAERSLRGPFEPIGMDAGEVVGRGADDQLALGGAEHGGGDPAVAFQFERRDRQWSSRIGRRGQRADSSGRPGRAEIDADGPAHDPCLPALTGGRRGTLPRHGLDAASRQLVDQRVGAARAANDFPAIDAALADLVESAAAAQPGALDDTAPADRPPPAGDGRGAQAVDRRGRRRRRAAEHPARRRPGDRHVRGSVAVHHLALPGRRAGGTAGTAPQQAGDQARG